MLDHFQEWLKELIPFVVSGAVSIGAWLIRLEGKTKNQDRDLTRLESRLEDLEQKTERDHSRLELRHEALEGKIVEQLTIIKTTLARIEGQFLSEKSG